MYDSKYDTAFEKSPFYAVCSHGVDGSRTRVQKPIPRPSTIVVHLLGFPTPDSGGQLSGFGSFIIRTYAQSFVYAVSCLLDASAPEDRYSGLTAAAFRQLLTRNYRLRLFLILRFNAISFG